jgi:nucleoid DNA-binding protein
MASNHISLDDLAVSVAEQSDIDVETATIVVGSMFKAITSTLVKVASEEVELEGFGTFYVNHGTSIVGIDVAKGQGTSEMRGLLRIAFRPAFEFHSARIRFSGEVIYELDTS